MIRYALINTRRTALQYLMASNVERERATKGEKRGLEGEESAIRVLLRERKTAEERHARFINTNLSLITFCNGI